MERPWLLLDVDGVLNPDFTGDEREKLLQGGDWLATHGYAEGFRWPLFLNRNHGPMLLEAALATGAELAWATTWNDAANTEVGPHVGLPVLPVLTTVRGAKHEGVLPLTQGRPFVWLDDEEYIAEAVAGTNGHVVRVNPLLGLTQADVRLAVRLLLAMKENDDGTGDIHVPAMPEGD